MGRKRQSVCTEALGVGSGLGTTGRQRDEQHPNSCSGPLTWAVDPMPSSGAGAAPPGQLEQLTVLCQPRHCQLQPGPGQQPQSLGREVGAPPQPPVVQAALGDLGASTGSVPRGETTRARQRDTHLRCCQFSTFHQH